jgi:hypothetical protein
MHDAVRGYVTGSSELLLVPVTTLPELEYLVTERLGSRVALQAEHTHPLRDAKPRLVALATLEARIPCAALEEVDKSPLQVG